MRVDGIELYNIELPLQAPERTNYGTNITRSVVLVRVTSDGLAGWGEAAPLTDPTWNYEYPGTTWPILRDYLAPAVVGQQLGDPRDVLNIYGHVLGRGIRGHHFAKASLEMAVWDLFARAEGIPLSQMIGGIRDRVPAGVSIGIQESPTELVRVVGSYLEQGYRRAKIKIMPGRDVGDLTEVRQAFPNALLMTDANSSYSLEDVALLQSMDQFRLMMHEQPLGWDDIVDHAKLQKRISTPICLDESILSPSDARKAIELGSCKMINIKIGRLGGIAASIEVHDLMHANGLAVWCGGMYESGVGRAHNLHIATLPGFTLPGDTSASARYFKEDIVDSPAVLNKDGTVSLPGGPGIGVNVVDRVLKKYTVQSWQIAA